MKGGGEQFNGREGETATLLLNLSITFDIDAGGFAPRQLNRYTLLGESRESVKLEVAF